MKKQVSIETRVEQIIDELDRHFARNMGQKSLYLNDSVATIQKRGSEFVVYYFDDKTNLLELDIKEATRFKKFANKDSLVSFLNENLYSWR
ncbi:MAG: hypothetical protein U0354_17165 [Candidatus Sericytochromatia bacterium]